MLHLHTVESGTLGLLKNLMSEADLVPFNLVGGTALALQIGHRVSVDLDLFGYPDNLEIPLIASLLSDYGHVEELTASRNIFSVKVAGVKVDFVRYRYPLLAPVSVAEGIRLVSLQDIAAMKIAAITGRGRKRDFTDLYFLMQRIPLPDMLDLYEKKYPDGNRFLVLKSLNYFADAEEDEDLTMLQKADWPTVKKTIETAVKQLYR